MHFTKPKFKLVVFNQSQQSQDAILAFLGRIGQFVLVFASMRVMTQMLSPSEVGHIVLITTATAFFALCFVNPVGMYFNRRLHSWKSSDRIRKNFHWYVVYLIIVCLLSIVIIIGIGHLNILPDGVSQLWLITLVCTSLFFNTSIQTIIPSLNLIGRVLPFMVLNLAVIGLGLFFASISVLVFSPIAEYWLSGIILAQALILPFAYRVFFGPNRSTEARLKKPEFQEIRLVFSFSWPITIAVLLQWFQMQGYRFFLEASFGLEALGMYAAGYGIAASLTSASETILTTWFQPRFYRSADSVDELEREYAWRHYSRAMVPGSILALTALLAAAPSLPRIMLGPAFHDTVLFVMLGAFSEWTRVMVGIVSLEAHRRMSTSRLVVPYVSGVFITYGTLFSLLNILGINAAPVSVGLGGLVITILLLRYVFKVNNKNKMGFEPNLFSAGKFFMYLIILLLCTSTALILQLNWLDLSNTLIAVFGCLIILVIWTGFAWYYFKNFT